MKDWKLHKINVERNASILLTVNNGCAYFQPVLRRPCSGNTRSNNMGKGESAQGPCMCVQRHVCEHTWRPEANMACLHLSRSTLRFEIRSLTEPVAAGLARQPSFPLNGMRVQSDRKLTACNQKVEPNGLGQWNSLIEKQSMHLYPSALCILGFHFGQ